MKFGELLHFGTARRLGGSLAWSGRLRDIDTVFQSRSDRYRLSEQGSTYSWLALKMGIERGD